MTKVRELFAELQNEVYRVIKDNPNISKQQIEQKLDLEPSGNGNMMNEFYALINPLLDSDRIERVARAKFKAIL